ncbi:unnamed protein product [Arabidopsis arenosa]|uniref:FLZ-type domain-containing protein n=1 Tax=Arabidopsis arenosa TaxID=38785 RepID=A0A8S2B1K3_ARAAE|nr:unnamed protein product [Arabidopsis arenosa]
MVGLSIVLEMTNNNNTLNSDGGLIISPKVVNKANVIVTTTVTTDTTNLRRCYQDSGFLEHCFLCRRKLLPAKDIYMYKGDRAFCSVECRSKQIIMDEEESLRREYCSLMDVKKKKSESPATAPSRYRRDPRNRAGDTLQNSGEFRFESSLNLSFYFGFPKTSKSKQISDDEDTRVQMTAKKMKLLKKKSRRRSNVVKNSEKRQVNSSPEKVIEIPSNPPEPESTSMGIWFSMLQEEEKAGPQTSTKEADMPDSKIDGLDYGVPSDQEEPKKDAAVEGSDAQIHDRVHSTKSVQTKVTYVEDPDYPDGWSPEWSSTVWRNKYNFRYILWDDNILWIRDRPCSHGILNLVYLSHVCVHSSSTTWKCSPDLLVT